jgi:hypothetical protein
VRGRNEGPRERNDVGIACRRVMSATGRPEREYRSAQREGTPMSAADTQRLFLRIPSKEAAAGGILIHYTQDK